MISYLIEERKNVTCKNIHLKMVVTILFVNDIDMIPEEGCDYSYPIETPIHISYKYFTNGIQTKIPRIFWWKEVLFNKEQVERTNGYSNDYWDWGMEDDDLFWRCYLEGYTNVSQLI